MWAIVPLKAPDLAKSRLSTVLNADERRDWYFEMAQRVIGALRATRGIDDVAVITANADVSRFAQALGARILSEPREAGTAQAFATAVTQLQPLDPGGVLMIVGDLPLVTPDDLEVLVQAAGRHEVVIVPDRFDRGTNALVCSPPGAIAPCFGEGSYARHLAAARQAGRTHHVLRVEGLALDIDVPADIEHLRQLQQGIAAGRSPHAMSRVLKQVSP